MKDYELSVLSVIPDEKEMELLEAQVHERIVKEKDLIKSGINPESIRKNAD